MRFLFCVPSPSGGSQGLYLFLQTSYWECHDLFELDGQWFLAVSPQGIECQNVYACGYFTSRSGGSFAEVLAFAPRVGGAIASYPDAARMGV